MEDTREARQNHVYEKNGALTWIPAQFHIVRPSDGSYGMDPYTLNNLMSIVNAEFYDAGIQIYRCGQDNFIDNDLFWDLDVSEDSLIGAWHDVPNVINVYFTGNLTYNGGLLCGYAYFPGGPDHLMMKNSCATNGSTFIHEWGHIFSLWHTHGKSNTGTTDELVDGSNCAVAGDDICDTPADPNLFGQTSGCSYTGSATDNNGHLFIPDPSNYMSYAPSNCRNSFSPMQQARMNYSAANDRPYLSCGTTPPCANPISTFPYTEGFENGWSGWTNNPAEDFDMSINSGGSPTAGTGPTSAAEGTQYVLAEATGIPPGAISVIESPCFDLSGTVNPQFSFNYHLYGPDAGQLVAQISTDGGYTWYGNPIFVFSISGDQGNSWQSGNIDLTPYINSTFVQIRLGVIIQGDVGDIAIDNLTLEDVTNCVAPPTLSLNWNNESCDGAADGTATANLSGGTAPFTFTWSNGATSQSISSLPPGNYQMTVVDANGCVVTGIFAILAANIVGTSCDDGNPNTVNDVYDQNCVCMGVEACSYQIIDFNNFDSNWGIWNDGGSDCRRSANDAAYAYSGNRCVRLRDNTSTSTTTTDILDLSSYEEITVDFTYYPRSMDNSNEDFWLQISTNGGSTFTTIEEWNRNDEFVNNVRYFENVVIPGPFSSNTKLRFRCDASGNSDWVYLDDIEISGCFSPQALIAENTGGTNTGKIPVESNQAILNGDASPNSIFGTITLPIQEESLSDLHLFPNPASSSVKVRFSSSVETVYILEVMDAMGKIVKIVELEAITGLNTYEIITDILPAGFYLVMVRSSYEFLSEKLILVD